MSEARTPVAGPGPSTGGSPELVGSSAPVSRLRELVRRTAARDGGGIRGMRERALAVGASLRVAAVSSGGTTVTVRVPVER